nr:hypothetical protein [Candidatus Njordarchaeota archaeon]
MEQKAHETSHTCSVGEYVLTLVVAFKCVSGEYEGVVISSDSRATAEFGLMTTEQKIVPIVLGDTPLAVAAGAGDIATVKDAIGQAADILKNSAKRNWKGQTARTVGDFAKAVKEIEVQLVNRFSYLRSMRVEVEMNMVLSCVASEGKAAIYVFDSRGLSTPAHDSPGYVCIGKGFVTGGNLLLRQFYAGTFNVDEGATLGAYIIDQVSKVDTGVGSFEGESYLFRIENGKPVLGQLKTEAFLEYKAKIVEREKLIKKIWEASYVIEPTNLLKIVEANLARTARKSHQATKRSTTRKTEQ